MLGKHDGHTGHSSASDDVMMVMVDGNGKGSSVNVTVKTLMKMSTGRRM